MAKRERKLKTTMYRPPVYHGGTSKEVYWPAGSFSYDGRQITVSEGHPRNPKTGNYDSGGPFSTVRFEYDIPSTQAHFDTGRFGYRYDGPANTPFPSGHPTDEGAAQLSKFQSDSVKDQNSKGATAISLCAPTNSVANLGTSLAESYREGLPSLPGVPTWKNRTKTALAAGSEFLNAEFGWLPLVDEISNVRDTVSHSRDILKQYHRDEGKSVHREFAFPESRTVTTTSTPGYRAEIGGSATLAGLFWDSGPQPVLTTTVETVVKSWFSGLFTYALPSRGDSWDGIMRNGSDADKLYGIDLTPSVIWELTPWSWAIDWFSNAGEVINNVTQFVTNGLVMRYGYIMTEKSTVVTYRLDRSGLIGLPSVPPSRILTVSKSRGAANPFGFGIGWEGLSPTQLAITAALGITRL